MVQLLQTILNMYLKGGSISGYWKVSHINFIYQKGSRNECSNNQGISIILTTAKLYEIIQKVKIEKEALEIEEHSAFQFGLCCLEKSFTLKHVIKRGEQQDQNDATFIDLLKTFSFVMDCNERYGYKQHLHKRCKSILYTKSSIRKPNLRGFLTNKWH